MIEDKEFRLRGEYMERNGDIPRYLVLSYKSLRALEVEFFEKAMRSGCIEKYMDMLILKNPHANGEFVDVAG